MAGRGKGGAGVRLLMSMRVACPLLVLAMGQ